MTYNVQQDKLSETCSLILSGHTNLNYPKAFWTQLPARGASCLLVSQIRGDLAVATTSRPEEVGWKCTSSSLPWPGCRVSSGLLGCSCSGSHKRHSFTFTHRSVRCEDNISYVFLLATVLECLTFFSIADREEFRWTYGLVKVSNADSSSFQCR